MITLIINPGRREGTEADIFTLIFIQRGINARLFFCFTRRVLLHFGNRATKAYAIITVLI